ncbi:gluconate 2-dehydrogenase subunit 3 family protein [uncultured Paludibaculum sp.]|uniref:gluconate 2-dehydrogenase subunit 3 family protein n=1 Tax=uncultured Paludibaculum sp. TaxID=1765020 RepID=UPI002AABDCD7|nr:gluconate 2-dehydrogenase subunit 3 family protein [uncultured Paludibaculum sp.]
MEATRRELLRNAAIAATLGQLSAEAMQHVHQHVAEEKKAASGVYKPKALNPHEYKTVTKLSDLIIPPEGSEVGGAGVGAPEFIDLLCSGSDRMAQIWLGGLAWLDDQCLKRYEATFLDAKPAQQTEILDLIAYRRNDTPETGPGIRFFDWARRMVVDAYFTSPQGVKAVGYKGNVGMQVFQVPKEAIAYAIGRSPFKEG